MRFLSFLMIFILFSISNYAQKKSNIVLEPVKKGLTDDQLLEEVQKLFPVITPHDLSINEYIINTWVNETEFFNTVNFKVKGIPFYKLIAYMKHCTIFKEELLVKGSSEMTHCELSNGLRIPRDGIFESVMSGRLVWKINFSFQHS